MRLLVRATRTNPRGVGFVCHVERTQHVNQKAGRYCFFRDYSQECLPEPPEFPGRRGFGWSSGGGRRGTETSSVPARCGSGHTKIDGIQKSKFSTGEAITPYKGVTNYDNYYEFSTDKYGPAELAKDFKTRPWTVSIERLLKKKQVLDVDSSIIKLAAPEERIYRHRCVEG
jgi:hypothetical protein